MSPRPPARTLPSTWASSPAPLRTWSSPRCPGQSKYRLVPAAGTWDNAERACEADGRGTHLVVIDDTLERGDVDDFSAGLVVWVGLSDRITEGTFLHVTGAPAVYTPWRAGDPSFAGAGCVELNASARTIHDVARTDLVSYVCECDAIPAGPGSF